MFDFDTISKNRDRNTDGGLADARSGEAGERTGATEGTSCGHWRGVVPPECNQAIDRMPTYLAEELGESERVEFSQHLRSCAGCHDKLLALEAAIFLADDGACYGG